MFVAAPCREDEACWSVRWWTRLHCDASADWVFCSAAECQSDFAFCTKALEHAATGLIQCIGRAYLVPASAFCIW